jgi:glycine/D-amino acid oxidase-like deaminating enzyme
MSNRDAQSTSLWMSTARTPQFPALTKDISCDVCIVGAGIAGVTTAYLLASAGKSVVLLENGVVGGGQTERTTAHLSNAIDARYFEIERLHGEEGARLTGQSHSAAIECIEDIVRKENIDCDFERLDGYLFLAPGDSIEILERELEVARRIGLDGLELLPHSPFEYPKIGACLRFPRQAQFHPLQYLFGVSAALGRLGARVFCDSHVTEVSGGRQARVRTERGPAVAAGAVVVATNTPINDRVAIHTKQAAYRTYVISASVPAGAAARALFWDTMDPYHYVRLSAEGEGARGAGACDTLIVGGEDHKTGQSDDAPERYRRLEEWTRNRFPVVGGITHRWSGQVFETIDGLAFIGRNPLDAENIYIATGDCGMGMTHGTIAGMVLSDLILQRENPWARLYDPSRKTIKAAIEYARENSNTAWQYTDWLTPGEVASAGELMPGCGAILRRGLTKVACYRDDTSMVHEFSAMCPHLGGVVQWNSAEHTWDCPAHGSRFDALGHVVTGPANSDLKPIEPSRSETDVAAQHSAVGDLPAYGAKDQTDTTPGQRGSR